MTLLTAVLVVLSSVSTPTYEPEPFGVTYQPPTFLVLAADAPGQPFGVRYEANFGFYMATLDGGAALAKR